MIGGDRYRSVSVEGTSQVCLAQADAAALHVDRGTQTDTYDIRHYNGLLCTVIHGDDDFVHRPGAAISLDRVADYRAADNACSRGNRIT